MKTAELIKRLIELDPTQDEEVLIGNHDILFIQRLPGYYDGDGQVLIRDPAKAPNYDVIGAKFVRGGTKIDIVTHSIEDALVDHPELPIETTTEAQAVRVSKWRREARGSADEIDAMKMADDAVRQMAWAQMGLEIESKEST